MFRTSNEKFGAYTRQRIYNDGSRHSFSFVPEHGACLLQVSLHGQNMLDGHTTAQEVEKNPLGKGSLLFPFPNRLAGGRYEWLGQTYKFPLNDEQGRENALHGFGMDKPFKVEKVNLDQNFGEAVCRYDYPGDNAAYPFPFRLTCTYRLEESGMFSTTFAVENTGPAAIPFGIGFHPYFRLSEKVDEMIMALPPVEMIGVNEQMIPNGKRIEYKRYTEPTRIGTDILDNCFVPQHPGRQEVSLKGPKGTLRYWQDEHYPFIQLFTPPTRLSLSIEPMSCNIDAFHNGEGVLVLEPGQGWSGRFGWSFEKA